MSGIDSATYTYVSMFIKYIISVLENDATSVNNLPQFVIDIFNQGETKIQMITYAAIGLFLFQFARVFLNFDGILSSIFGETLAKNKERYVCTYSIFTI